MTHLTRTWRLALVATIATTAGAARAADTVPSQTATINDELTKSWKAVDLKPSKKASDYEFVRRVFIDIVGRIPTAEEVKDFAEVDGQANKRAKLVHRLLYDKDYHPRVVERVNPKDPKTAITYDYAGEYARNFSNIWGVWLMTRGGVAEVYHDALELWLEDQFSKNTPWNQVVKQLLTATGKTNENGAVAFIMSHLGEAVPAKDQMAYGKFDAVPITSRVTKTFLGVQTNCIQCHDHPFNPEWKQDNYWGMNAFFRQIERDGTPAPKEGNVGKKKMTALPVSLRDNPELNKGARIFFERRSGIMHAQKPNFLPNLAELEKDGSMPRRTVPNDSSKSRREVMADYIVQHDNFAKAYVNRMWAHFFGRGMNELPAADDFGGHNKVVHPDLLNKLASEFVESGYDTKKLIEWICSSDAYSLTYQANGLADGKGGNAKDEAAPYFTRMQLKSMSPEVLFESLEVATRLDMAPDKDAKKDKKEKWMEKLTRNFGDDEGNEVTFNGTIIQALLMMNGGELNSEVSRKDGTSAVDKAMNRYKSGAGYNEMGVINELYLMALARKPSGQPTIYLPVKDPKTGKDKLDAKGKPVTTGPISEASFLAQQVTNMKAHGPNQVQWKAFFEDVFWSLLNTNEFILNH
ncbi:MAG TPA: DUF1549 domain-containing protein [Gemmataceae bacterium]|jgi:hypothetical protein|nr:DUF1549 domain-containing protein [Gemmataceae bacterium]